MTENVMPYWKRIRSILISPTIGPFIALIITCIFFSTQTDRFLTGRNLSLIVQQVVVVGTLAIGQTLIILTAGIDLSNGAVMALGNVLMTKLAVANGVPPVLAIGIGLLATGAFGLANGLLVTRLRLPPFIVTLGTLNIAFALTRIYTTSTITHLPDTLTFLGSTFTIGETSITYSSVLMFLLFLLFWFILRENRIS